MPRISGSRNDKLFDDSGEVNLKVDNPNQTVTTKDPIDEGYRIARDFYRSVLSRPFENIVVFTGAGTSISTGGKSMATLWGKAFPVATKESDEKFLKQINFPIPADQGTGDLEALLSQAQRAEGVLDATASSAIVARIGDDGGAGLLRGCPHPLLDRGGRSAKR